MNINVLLFQNINQLAGKYRVLDNLMLFASQYLSYGMVAVVVGILVIGIVKRNRICRYGAIHTFLILLIGISVNALLGVAFYVPRPFVSHRVHLLYVHTADSSFPSDHATASMSLAAGLKSISRLLHWIFVLFSIWVGFSRVYVGHHYPLDIAGSFLIVWAVSVLYRKFLENKVSVLLDNLEQRIFASRKSIR